MLAITGGSAWEAGPETILDAPYASYLFDLIEGPDNWYLVRAAPGDRGIVCAALRAPSASDQAPLLVWAARYAASANGRGPDRVGLANASSLAGLDVPAARASLEAIVRAAGLAAMDPARCRRRGPRPAHLRPAPRARCAAAADAARVTVRQRTIMPSYMVDDAGLGRTRRRCCPPPVGARIVAGPVDDRQPPAVPPCGRVIAASSSIVRLLDAIRTGEHPADVEHEVPTLVPAAAADPGGALGGAVAEVRLVGDDLDRR